MQNKTDIEAPVTIINDLWGQWPESMKISKENCRFAFYNNVDWESEKGKNEFKEAVCNFFLYKKVQFLDHFLDLDFANNMRPYWKRYTDKNIDIEGEKHG
jgi:hypothetical protein